MHVGAGRVYAKFTALLAPILPFDRVAIWMRFASSPHSQDSSTGTEALVFLPHFCSLPAARIRRPGISRVYAQKPPSILSILFEGRCTISLPISHTQCLGTDIDELSHCRRRQQAHGDATPLARRNVLQVTNLFEPSSLLLMPPECGRTGTTTASQA